MRIVTLRAEQFEKYALHHRYRNYFQTTEYGNTMKKFGYNSHYLGIVDNNNNLIGATLVIYKEIMLNYKIAYCPRGILFDYEDTDNVEEMARKLKRLLSKQGFILLRMDPYIPISIRNNTGDLLNINNQEDLIINNLVNAGFDYKGKNLFFENENPRWESLVLFNKDPNLLFEDFDKRTRTKIRRASNSGITVELDEKRDIKSLYRYIKENERKPFNFYREILNSFGQNAEVYYAKVDTEIFLINSRQLYEQEQQNNEQIADQINMHNSPKERDQIINKKMESDKLLVSYKNSLLAATELLKKNPDGFIIGGCIVLTFDNAAFILVEGFDDKYSYLNSNYLLKWKLIEEYSQRGYKYINFNAVVGEFDQENEYSGLNEAKLGFNTIVTEYIGEFDIILNNVVYNLYKKVNK